VEVFDELIQYFCFGCYFKQPLYTDTVKKEVRICREFAESVWGTSLKKLSTKFDNCGLQL
jgi:hypothetical protein